MQITSKFTIAVHILTAIDYFKDSAVTSGFLADSVGANAVIVRGVMGELKAAGLIAVSQGRTGIALARPLSDITLYDVYAAVGAAEGSLFRFHDSPNPQCPVGRNIHAALDGRLAAAEQAMEASLRAMTVADVAADIQNRQGREAQ